MPAWRNWYHVTGCTYGAWLPGDPRGWRARHHRQHVNGDYKDPPPKGLYDGLHRHARASARAPTVFLDRRQRRIALEALVEKLGALGVEVIATSVDAVHYHVLGRFADGQVRRAMGQAKGCASRVLGLQGLAGAVWAKRSRALPIEDRRHQINVFHYIAGHAGKGACAWTFREGIICKPTG